MSVILVRRVAPPLAHPSRCSHCSCDVTLPWRELGSTVVHCQGRGWPVWHTMTTNDKVVAFRRWPLSGSGPQHEDSRSTMLHGSFLLCIPVKCELRRTLRPPIGERQNDGARSRPSKLASSFRLPAPIRRMKCSTCSRIRLIALP